MSAKKYVIEMTHRYEVVTENIREVLDNYEFPFFEVGVIGDPEFLDGKNTYEEVE